MAPCGLYFSAPSQQHAEDLASSASRARARRRDGRKREKSAPKEGRWCGAPSFSLSRLSRLGHPRFSLSQSSALLPRAASRRLGASRGHLFTTPITHLRCPLQRSAREARERGRLCLGWARSKAAAALSSPSTRALRGRPRPLSPRRREGKKRRAAPESETSKPLLASKKKTKRQGTSEERSESLAPPPTTTTGRIRNHSSRGFRIHSSRQTPRGLSLLLPGVA